MKDKRIDKKTLARINTVYRFLLNNQYSTFYKDKYSKSGIKLKSINTINEFEKLPFLTREELVTTDPHKFFFLPKDEIRFMGVSSGTTNQNSPLLVLCNELPKSVYKYRDEKHLELGISTIMLLYSTLPLQYRINLHTDLTNKGILSIFGDINNFSLSATIAAKMNIDAMQTTSSILYFFIPYLKKTYDLNKIKLIVLGGEFTSEQKLQYFRKNFKNAYFKFTCGSVETGMMGQRCDYLENFPPRFFHPVKNLYQELINPEKESELVVTSLIKDFSPQLIRYRTGNHAKITNFKCKCGQTKLMEIFGKLNHDVVKISGTFIYADEVYQALLPFTKYLKSLDFRLHIYEDIKREKIRPKLILQLIPKDNIKESKEIKEIILNGVSNNLILTPSSSLSDLIEKKIFLPLEIEYLENLPFSVKQRLVVSHIT